MSFDHRVNLNLANPGFAQAQHFAFINLLKAGMGFGSFGNTIPRFPTLLSSNGTPASSPSDDSLGFLLNVPAFYTGSYVLKWPGTGAFKIIADQTITVTVGNGFVTSNSGGVLVVSGTNPKVVFNLNAATSGNWQGHFPASGTYSGMGGPQLCRLAHETAMDAGKKFNPDFIADIKLMNPKILRMMQWSDGGGRALNDRSEDAVSWINQYYPNGLYAGDITLSGSAFTCSKPSGTPGTITQGEVIYGYVTGTNAGGDTLNIGARGAKAIFDQNTGFAITASQMATGLQLFTYDALIDKYWWTSGAVTTGVPLSVMVSLCNEVGCAMWYCFSVFATDADVTATTTYLRDNLNGTAYLEYANEIWGGAPILPNTILNAQSRVMFPTNIGVGDPMMLRLRQIMGLATTNWAPRSMSSLKRVLAWINGGDAVGLLAISEGGNLASYGFSTYPNRPIDFVDVVSYATYVQGPNVPAYQGGYVASGQAALYTAADNYASPNPVLQQQALDFVDNDLRQGTGGNGDVQTLLGFSGGAIHWYANWENAVTAYDVPRANVGKPPFTIEHYEGGIQINGPFAPTLNALSLDGTTYGGTGAGVYAIPQGGRIQNLFTAYKHDARYKKLIIDMFNQFFASGSHATTPSWYNMVGDGPSQWSIYDGGLYDPKFQSFNAIQQFDLVGTRNLKGNF